MTRRNRLILLLFLLLGAALRFQGQAEMSHLLHHDEAAYGVDALSLLEQPRIQVYFPANTGREGLWMYMLSPLVAGIGAEPLALHLTSAIVGIFSLAAVYLLAREVYPQGAVWAVGAMAVLYWHVHLSHIGFRVITFPLMGALAFAAILRAQRINRAWYLAGLMLGLLLYSYVAAQVYFAYGIGLLVLWTLFDKARRKGAFLAIVIAILVALPLWIAMLQPSETSLSVSRAAASSIEEVWGNLIAWARAWLDIGDRTSTHNLPLRPVMDLPLAILAFLGIVGAWWLVRKRWLILWWLGLVAVGLLPTVLSTQAPHFLRGSGLILPVVLLLGMGGAIFNSPIGFFSNKESDTQTTKSLTSVPPLNSGEARRGSFFAVIPFLLILWAGWNTYQDFQTWLREETQDFGISYDYRLNAGMAIIEEDTPSDAPIIMTGVQGHPNAEFLAAGMNRPIYIYEWTNDEACYLSPREGYVALDLPIIANSFAARVLPYVANIEAIYAHPENEINVFLIEPLRELTEDWDTPFLGDNLQMRVIPPTSETVRAGEAMPIYLAMRFRAEFAREDYRILAHLQGEPSPYEGGTLFATADEALCDLLYSGELDTDSNAIQILSLAIPVDLPAGDYQLALGLYEPDSLSRLPVSPAENAHDYFTGWRFTVLE